MATGDYDPYKPLGRSQILAIECGEHLSKLSEEDKERVKQHAILTLSSGHKAQKDKIHNCIMNATKGHSRFTPEQWMFYKMLLFKGMEHPFNVEDINIMINDVIEIKDVTPSRA